MGEPANTDQPTQAIEPQPKPLPADSDATILGVAPDGDTAKSAERPTILFQPRADDDARPVDAATGADFELGSAAMATPGSATLAGPRFAPGRATTARPTVPGYEILSELGRGGMGVVYRARHLRLDRIVALKMILAGAHAGADHLARFGAEAQAVAHLQSPNIIQIYEVGEHDGLPYLSLEFVDGVSLAQKIGGKPQNENEAAAMIETLARAMHHAHQHNVIHRDLKPANVLLTAEGSPKITDFGLAKRLEGQSSSQTRSGTILGSPSYMAPEQALGEVHQIGPHTDVYALGAILYEMLTGRPPFLAATPMDTVMQVVRDEPVAPSQLQPKLARDLETICLKCLQKEPAKRYVTAAALADDLGRFRAGEPITARPIGDVERFVRWCRRNPKIAGLSAAVVSLLVAGLVGSVAAAVRIRHERNDAVAAKKRAEQNEQLAKTAQTRAERAEQNARENARQATLNARLADENYRLAAEQSELALESLKTVVQEIDQELRDKLPLQAVRHRLLEMALDKLEAVVATEGNASLIARSKAAALMQRGFILSQLGQGDQALKQYQQCHEILSRLAESPATGVEADKARANLAASCDVLGGLYQAKEPTKARELYLRGLELRLDLTRRPESDFYSPPLVEKFVSDSYERLGNVSLAMGESKVGREYHANALAVRERLIAADPENAELQRSLASSLGTLGDFRFRDCDLDGAKDHLSRAVDLRTKLSQGDPLNDTAKVQFASALGSLGDMRLFSGDLAAAEETYAQSLSIYSQLAATDSRPATQRAWALAHYRLATALLRQRKPGAARLYQKCLDIHEALAGKGGSKIELMIALARCGKFERAAALADEVRNMRPPRARSLYYAASCLALCCADRPPSENGESASAQLARRATYIERTFSTLREAIRAGYRDAVELGVDPDFDHVRELPEFQAVLDELRDAHRKSASPP